MFSDDLTLLTEFPKPLIMNFEAEAIGNQSTKENIKNFYLPFYFQYKDYLSSYLYLQDQILPQIKSLGIQNITSEQWLFYLKNINRLMLKTMAESLENNIQPGEFRKGHIVIFRDSEHVLSAILEALNRPSGNMSIDTLCKNLGDRFNKSPKTFFNYMKLLHSMKRREDIEFRERSNLLTDNIILNCHEKLLNAYLDNKLTVDEKIIVEEIELPCMYAEDIPHFFKDFFGGLSLKLLHLDKDNNKAVAEFIANVFMNIIKAHAFFNGNGRTATCFINLLLNLIGKPAISLYYSAEKHDKSSEYSKAMEILFRNQQPLANLIFKRLNENYQNDEALFDFKILNIELCETLLKKNQNHPGASLDTIYALEKRAILNRIGIPNDFELNKEQQNEIHRLIIEPRQNLQQVTLFADKIDPGYLLNKVFPKKSLWKYYAKANLALLDCNSLDEANAIAREINNLGLMMRANVSKKIETGVYVVKLDVINKETLALLNVEKLQCSLR